ncbi:hypothetical protein B0H10DRAFT_2024587 [Mycena sp. CBHHK59/15]|nr:hypothetical protein B0H10DRAFT_2024587 [Mycena sp. CBHHK59/15]
MILRLRRRVSSCRTFCRTFASTPLYSPKVQAYPFKLSTSEAIVQLAPYGSLFSPDSPGAHLSSLGARFLPFLGFQPQQPIKIVPVYFPAWLIDAEVEAKVSLSTDRGTEDGVVSTVFLNSCLSSISLLSRGLASNETVPFSAELETQFDAKITCLPFTTSPQNLRIIPESISTNLLGAYPVLIPIYLAQYSMHVNPEVDSMSITVLLEAHREKGRIMVENAQDAIQGMLPEATQFLYQNYYELGSEVGRIDDYFHYTSRGGVASFANVSSVTISPPINFDPEQLGDWLDGFMRYPTAQKLVAANSGDSEMEDPRIRPFTEKEVKQVRHYFTLGQERSKAYNLLDSISKIPPDGVASGAFKEVEKYAASFDARREEALPSWWKEWQRSTDKNDR